MIKIQCEVKSTRACAHTKREEEEERKKMKRARNALHSHVGAAVLNYSADWQKGAELVLFAECRSLVLANGCLHFYILSGKHSSLLLLLLVLSHLLSWPFSRHSAASPLVSVPFCSFFPLHSERVQPPRGEHPVFSHALTARGR